MVIALVKTSQVSLVVTTCGLVNSYRRFKDRSLQDQLASLLALLRSEDEGTTLFRNVCNHSRSTRRNIPKNGLLTKHKDAAVTIVLPQYRPTHNMRNISFVVKRSKQFTDLTAPIPKHHWTINAGGKK